MTRPTPRVETTLLPRLRADLTAVGFTVDGLEAYLGPTATAALRREQPFPAERLTRAHPTPLGALVRLFTLGLEVDFDEVDAALPTLRGDGLVALDLAERTGAGLRACCDLQPHADETHAWWVASDLTHAAMGAALEPDHVLGVGSASLTVASWTPRTPVRAALDLGTGSGIQALHLDAHADRVVVTDTSDRALRFARFNAALAGSNWDVRAGDMLAPVAGERFDLVVSNPPFVITPRGTRVPDFEYRDAGAHGDDIVAGLVRGVGDVLAPGGVALFIGNWEIAADADWRDRWREWLEPTGLDAWVVQRDEQDPAQYAEMWARDGGHQPGSWIHDELYAAWLDDFDARGVARIGFGVAALHRPLAPREPFVDLQEVSGPVTRPMGPTIAAGLAARDRLAGLDDDAVLDVAWHVAPDVIEQRHARPGATDPEVILLGQGGGLRLTHRVDTATAALVGVCDGELTARAALVVIAALLDVDAADLLTRTTPTLRRLVADGFLTPEPAPAQG